MKKGYIYIFLSALIFSTMEIASKVVAKEVNPFQLTFVRFLIGGLILFPFAIKDIKTRNLNLNRNDFLFFTLTGFLCVVVSMSFFQLAVLYTKASTVAVVFSTNPVFTIPFAYFILREKLNRKTLLSVLLSLIGVLFIFNPFNLSPDILGITLSILAAVAFSLYSVVGKVRMEKYGSFISTCFSFLIGDAMLFIAILYFRIPVLSGIGSHNILHIMYLGVVVTGLGYLFYFLAIKETSVIASSIVFFIKPALAPLLSLILIGETIPLNSIAGIAFILLGAYMMLQSKRALANA